MRPNRRQVEDIALLAKSDTLIKSLYPSASIAPDVSAPGALAHIFDQGCKQAPTNAEAAGAVEHRHTAHPPSQRIVLSRLGLVEQRGNANQVTGHDASDVQGLRGVVEWIGAVFKRLVGPQNAMT